MIICKECGQQNEEGAAFCGDCGSFLEWSGERIEEPAAAAPVEEAVDQDVGGERVGLMERVKTLVAGDEDGEAAVAPVLDRDQHDDDHPAEPPAPGAVSVATPEATGLPDEVLAARAREEAEHHEREQTKARKDQDEAAAEEARARADAEERARAEAEARAKQEEARRTAHEARVQAEARAAEEAEARRREEEARAQAEAARLEAEAARRSAEAQKAAEAEERQRQAEARAAEEARVKEQAEARAREEEARAKAEEARAKAEEARAKAEAEARAKAEAEAARAAERVRRAAALVAKPPPPSTQPAPTRPGATQPKRAASAVPAVPAGGTPAAQKPGVRQPAAQKPAARKIKKATKPLPAPRKKLRPGDLICGNCGEGNAPERKFCRRCGQSLAEAVITPTPWYRRLLPKKKRYRAGDRPFKDGQGPGVRGSVARARFKTFVALRKVMLVLATLGLVGVVYAFVGPARSEVRGWLRDPITRIRQIVVPRFEPVHAAAVTANHPALADHPPEHVIDGGKNTWWSEDGPGPGEGHELFFTFQEPTQLAKMIIRSGAGDDPESFLFEPRPQRMHWRATRADGQIVDRDIELVDTREPQVFDLKVDDVVELALRIDTVYVGRGGEAGSLTEVEFLTRQ